MVEPLDRAIELRAFLFGELGFHAGDLFSECLPDRVPASEVATSASTVRPLSDTSASPPSTMIFCCVPPDVTVRMPGRIAATTGACPASTPKSPSTPGTST